MGEEEVFGQPYELSVNLQGIRDTLRVKLLIVSEDNPDLRSKVFDLNKNSRRSPVRRDDPTAAGTQFQVEIDLPKGFKPGLPPSPRFSLKQLRVENNFIGLLIVCILQGLSKLTVGR